MPTRAPAVAGQFYPQSPERCRLELRQCLGSAETWTPDARAAAGQAVVGGIVPHAGWACSGAVAGAVISALLAEQPETVVIFGAVHHRGAPLAAVYTSGAWATPLGPVAIDEELARAATASSPLFTADEQRHGPEHSIEVQVPFVRELAPRVKLLPIMVVPSEHAATIGTHVAEAAARLDRHVGFLGSTDLTHYGPRYGFTPHGTGPQGLAWARRENDRRMIDLILALAADRVVDEARTHHNACGSGAVAAAIAASVTAGATRARLLRHTTSSEVLADRLGAMQDAVGYAGIVFERNTP